MSTTICNHCGRAFPGCKEREAQLEQKYEAALGHLRDWDRRVGELQDETTRAATALAHAERRIEKLRERLERGVHCRRECFADSRREHHGDCPRGIVLRILADDAAATK